MRHTKRATIILKYIKAHISDLDGFITQKEIAKATGLCQATVGNGIRDLRRDGAITIETVGVSSRYSLSDDSK